MCFRGLYGAPGTGKTSFARALAKEVGRTAWEIKQGEDDGRNMKAEARMMGIQICNEQESSDESLIIVDEADELLRGGGFPLTGMMFGGGRKSTEKGVINTILDEMKMPAVWISNTSACEIDESVRRRFDYSICFEELNSTQRMAIWRNIVGSLSRTLPVHLPGPSARRRFSSLMRLTGSFRRVKTRMRAGR